MSAVTSVISSASAAGVYQEVMGSAHNMLGAPHVAEIRLSSEATAPAGEAALHSA